jgi:ABC-type Fe3+/spermidine/putrescine transport system ATPase subunit
MTQLELVALTKIYSASSTGIFDVNLTIEPGELLVLLGPSGCGKTTTLRLIAGLDRPSSGDVRFDGRSVVALPPEQRAAPMVFQQHALFPFMSVGNNIAFGLKVRKLSRTVIREKVAQALAAVQLSGYEDRWPDELSGGQRQRVALARVLAIEPRILLLDEPLSNLDRALREELREVVRGVQRMAGITTIFVTHDQTEAVALADRIALMFDGRLHQVDTPRAFFEAPATARVARFFGGVNFIDGVKRGRVVETPLGTLEIENTPLPDGEVLVSIRPEAIEIGANGHNNLDGRLLAYQYYGSAARCQASVNGCTLSLVAPPFASLSVNGAITLHLPRERLILFPAEKARNGD